MMPRVSKKRQMKMIRDRLMEHKVKNRESEVPNLGLDRDIQKASDIVERLSQRPQAKQLF